jgi:hypothetical protein
MIEWFMFGALGFFLGCLLGLMLAPPLWNRAVKLTTRKLEATMPMSLADIQADKDQLRAEFAIELRKVEVALEKSKEKAARELIEANKRRVEIQVLNTELGGVKGQFQESQNANRVLQQTIKRRLPDLDARLKAAKKALTELETVNSELRNTVASQSEALKVARGTVHNQRADIDRLRMALESGGAASMRGSAKSDGRAVAESHRLAAELSRAQEELDRAKTSAQENAFLRRELSRLASQILTATRGQATQAAQMAMQPPQAEIAYAEETVYAEETEYTEEAAAEEAVEVAEAEDAWHAHHAGNGAAQEPVMEEAPSETEDLTMETEEMEYAEAYAEEPAVHAEEEYVEGEDHEEAPEEPDEPRGLAQRFAARRAKRNAGKGGGSLTDRLRGLVSDSSETRT